MSFGSPMDCEIRVKPGLGMDAPGFVSEPLVELIRIVMGLSYQLGIWYGTTDSRRAELARILLVPRSSRSPVGLISAVLNGVIR